MGRVTIYDVVDMKEVHQAECEHKNTTYHPTEYHETDVGVGTITHISIKESYTCDDCDMELDIPEPDEDIYRDR